MKKKNNTKLAITIVIVIGLFIILAGLAYDYDNKHEQWIVCDYVGSIESLKETVKFRYEFDQMYGYYEETTITAESEQIKEDVINNAKEFSKEFTESDDLSYKLEEDGLVVKTKFYIKVLTYPDFINNYFNQEGITVNSSMQEVKSKLGEDSNCKIA